jgi:Tol biopolymer transport system component
MFTFLNIAGLLLLITALVCNAQISFDYLGQKVPGKIPEVFAPGIISKENAHSRLVISPDGKEIYWNIVDRSTFSTRIQCIKRVNNTWSGVQTPSFALTGLTKTPLFSPGGSKLFFSYRQSINEPWTIKYVEKTDTSWSEPKTSGFLLNTTSSFTGSGMVYFSDTMGNRGNYGGIYRATYSGTGYSDITPLNETINSDAVDYTPFISPDGSFLLFSSSRPSATERSGNMFVYISFNVNNKSWTIPQKFVQINGRFPSISPDGKYIFFCGDDGNFYWIDINLAEQLRKTVMNNN